jgi:hypothetical protein
MAVASFEPVADGAGVGGLVVLVVEVELQQHQEAVELGPIGDVGFLGRKGCHILMNRLGDVLLLEHAPRKDPAAYVPVSGVIDLPIDEAQLNSFVKRAGNELARWRASLGPRRHAGPKALTPRCAVSH